MRHGPLRLSVVHPYGCGRGPVAVLMCRALPTARCLVRRRAERPRGDDLAACPSLEASVCSCRVWRCRVDVADAGCSARLFDRADADLCGGDERLCEPGLAGARL